MYYHRNAAAEDCVGPKFCTMPHTVMVLISCNSNATLDRLQLGEHATLVLLPVQVDGWKELILQKKTVKNSELKIKHSCL